MRILALLLALLPALALASDGYGPPTDPPWVQMRPADDGHTLVWEVADDADGWRILSRGVEVWRAPGYLHPGYLRATPLPATVYEPGDRLEVCATWRAAAGAVEQCHEVTRAFQVWVGVVH